MFSIIVNCKCSHANSDVTYTVLAKVQELSVHVCFSVSIKRVQVFRFIVLIVSKCMKTTSN